MEAPRDELGALRLTSWADTNALPPKRWLNRAGGGLFCRMSGAHSKPKSGHWQRWPLLPYQEHVMHVWWQYIDADSVSVPSFSVDDVHFVQPVGFVWFSKPRYRVKARTRRS